MCLLNVNDSSASAPPQWGPQKAGLAEEQRESSSAESRLRHLRLSLNRKYAEKLSAFCSCLALFVIYGGNIHPAV